MDLQKLINFKIYDNDILTPDPPCSTYIFWQEQFKNCTSLASADIIFNFSKVKPNKLFGLFAGCEKLSYIRVRDLNSSFVGEMTSNDWLIAEDLPASGTLILPIIYKISDVKNIISGFTQNTEDILIKDNNNSLIGFKQIVNDHILLEDCISSLLIKDWTIKFEE